MSGILFYTYQHHILIIRYPSYQHEVNQFYHQRIISKKPITLYYWHTNQWHKERIELIWHDDLMRNLHYLINSWLTFLDDENIMQKKVNLQTVLLSENKQTAYLSFDRNPLNKEESTWGKWHFIEGLLKTVCDNELPIKYIQFLVHHQPMHDLHLDFINPWPTSGFLS